MTNRHFIVALAIALITSFLLLMLVAWITGGAYSAGVVRGLDVALVIPMFLAMKLGFERTGALAVAFLTYFMVVFAFVMWYVAKAVVKVRRSKE